MYNGSYRLNEAVKLYCYMEKTHRRIINFTLRTTRKLLLTKLAIRLLFLLKYSMNLSYLLVISIKRAEASINTPPPSLSEKGNVP